MQLKLILVIIALACATVSVQAKPRVIGADIMSDVLGDHSHSVPQAKHLPAFLKEFDRILSEGPEYAEAYFGQMDRMANATDKHEAWKDERMQEEGFWSDSFNPFKWHDTSTKTKKEDINDKQTGSVMFTGSGVTVTRDGDNGIMGCFESDSLDVKTCMKLYANLENMSYRISLLFQNEVVFHRSGKVTLKVCLDEDKLITIISMIPVLLPYAGAINKAKTFLRRIPMSLFSVCVGVKGAKFQRKPLSFKSCPHVEYKVACLRSTGCYIDDQKTLGCFTLGAEQPDFGNRRLLSAGRRQLDMM